MTPDSWLWLTFSGFVLGMLFLDLFVLHRKAHTISFREAVATSIMWVTVAMVFLGLVYHWRGPETALEFLTGYLLEKSLSVDNLFVFILIFSFFKVPAAYKHRVLFWGIMGALVMRAIFIFAGVALIKRFDWILYVFGGILLVSAFRMLRGEQDEVDLESNWMLRLIRRFIPVSKDYDGPRFFTMHGTRKVATPLFVVLMVVEATDVVFAVDSIPAVLAITLDPLVVYSSNVFAILGLRAMFFMLQGLMEKLKYLHYGLAAILGFVGFKLVAHSWVKVPIPLTLSFITGVLLISLVVSLYKARPKG